MVQTKKNVYFARPKPLPTTRRFLSTLKGGRHLIAKVYTHPLLPAILFRPGGTFFSQTPVLSVDPSCAPPTPALPPPLSTNFCAAVPFSPRKLQNGWGIPSHQLRARCGNGLGHTFTSEAWNDTKALKMAPPDLGKRAAPYLHTFIPMGNEKKEILTFFMFSIGILVCRYGFG